MSTGDLITAVAYLLGEYRRLDPDQLDPERVPGPALRWISEHLDHAHAELRSAATYTPRVMRKEVPDD